MRARIRDFRQEQRNDAQALTCDQIREELDAFLDRNPTSRIEEVESSSGKKWLSLRLGAIRRLSFFYQATEQSSSDILTTLFFQNGIPDYGTKTQENLKLYIQHITSPMTLNYDIRSFRFRHKGRDYTCRFDRASEELLEVAKNAVPVSESPTQYRNLYSFFSTRRIRVSTSRSMDNLANLCVFGSKKSIGMKIWCLV